MAKEKTKYVIGDICWAISEEEYEQFVLPAIAEAFIGKGEITRGGKTVGFLTGDAGGAGWPQDSGVLGVLRFEDLEPEYQKENLRLSEGGYVVIFESDAGGVGELSEGELKEQGFYEGEVTEEERVEMYGGE